MSFRDVTRVDELWEGDMSSHQVGTVRVLLVKLDGRVHAYEDRCAHQGVPLSDGELNANVLRCAAHHYEYDARTGQGINPKCAHLRRFPVAIEGGAVQVDIDARSDDLQSEDS